MTQKMNRFRFLINPTSGGGQGKKVAKHLPEIMQSFELTKEDWAWEYTLRENMDAQIRKALLSTETLIVVGGDGTISAVLAEVLKSAYFETKIGLIPLGTGNDLARSLGIYRSFVNRGLLYTIRKLIEAESRMQDLWLLNSKPVMAAYVSAGFDALVAAEFNRDRSEGRFHSNSVLANKWHYLKCSWQNRMFRILDSSKVTWVSQNDEVGEKNLNGMVSILIGNISSYAGGSNPFPNSNSSDALLDLVFLPNLMSMIKAVVGCRTPFIAKQLHRRFESLKVKNVELVVPRGVAIQVDGEDRSDLAGSSLKIEYAGKAKLLYLES